MRTDKTSEPLVSIIIPTYNYGGMIGETLNRLGHQTLADWECIVVDDGSTDDTREVVARVAEREPSIYYAWQANQRQAVAKNTGISKSRGKYLQFLDADDFIESRKLERQVAYLEAHREVDIVYGSVRYFRPDNPNERLHSMGGRNLPWMPQVSGGREVLEALVRHNIMVINSPLVRREVVEKVGSFDATLPPAEDWDYWLRCAQAGARFHFSDMQDTRALVRMHSKSSSQDRWRMHWAGLTIRKKLAASLKDAALLALNRDLRAKDESEFGMMEAALGRSWSSAVHLIRAAWFERRLKWRIKTLGGALIAPFVSHRSLQNIMVSPLAKLRQPSR